MLREVTLNRASYLKNSKNSSNLKIAVLWIKVPAISAFLEKLWDFLEFS